MLSVAALFLSACSTGSTAQSEPESMASAPITQEIAPTPASTPTTNSVATTNSGSIGGQGVDAAPAQVDQDIPPLPEAPTGQLPQADPPAAAIAKVQTKLAATGADLTEGTTGQSGELLDVIEPLDAGPQPDEVIDVRNGARINEAGERNQLDQAAGLACANVEIALTALDDGEITGAADHLDSAARRAEESAVTAFADWIDVLDDQAASAGSGAVPDIATLFAFLTTCTHGGYEL